METRSYAKTEIKTEKYADDTVRVVRAKCAL